MEQYGYMEKMALDNSPSEEAFKVAVTKFQHYFALEENGEFNDLTKKEMSKPRCGVSEANLTEKSMNTRYQIKGPKWDKTHLTWR